MIYLVSTDGYRDGIFLGKYATNESEIGQIVCNRRAEGYFELCKDFVIDIANKKYISKQCQIGKKVGKKPIICFALKT